MIEVRVRLLLGRALARARGHLGAVYIAQGSSVAWSAASSGRHVAACVSIIITQPCPPRSAERPPTHPCPGRAL